MTDKPIPFPEVKDLAHRAYAASGCKSVPAFSKFLGGVGERTVWRWLRGEGPLSGMADMVLTEVAGGWRPTSQP